MAGCNRFEMAGKRIRIVSSEYPPGTGGKGHHTCSLSSGLHRYGLHVEVMTVSDYATEEMKSDFDARHPFRTTRYSRQGWRKYPKRIAITMKGVREGVFDRVYPKEKFAFWLGLALKTMRPRRKTPAILHGGEVGPSHLWLRLLTNRAVASCDRALAVSSSTAYPLPPGLRKNKAHAIIPNGIDFTETPADDSESETTLRGHPRLLTVGHVSPRKGQHRVIKALPALAETFPEVHCHMVGRSIQRERLETLAGSPGVSDRITFHSVAPTHGTRSYLYYEMLIH
jgi:phosphatidylinositol alpha-1,6-mannosyltransferase